MFKSKFTILAYKLKMYFMLLRNELNQSSIEVSLINLQLGSKCKRIINQSVGIIFVNGSNYLISGKKLLIKV